MKARLPKGYGKQNVNDLMRQAQEMQDRMQQKQTELEETEYTITAGGGMVEMTMLGNHQVVGVKLKPEAVQPDDIEMLEDMIAAAVNQAVRTVDESAEQAMAEISGGYNIPGVTG
ncbi:YbaB/EbfC family nucleoid-associated protein [Ruminococcaceae bacterium OttesenSCG-928-A16]|nr:YbaB/EbfC family nucleoid-associated protein [Ruminococcaceae bacterium OttesenSCG-928-A16]